MKCVHCLNELTKRTKEKDHLFPSAWYPDTTDTKVQRWTFPSCSTCNRAYGAIEEELLVSFGLAIEPSHPASKGICQKALNALDARRSQNEKKRLARITMLKKITGRIIDNASTDSTGLIPNMARGEESKRHCTHSLFIPDHFTMLCRKFVKGVTWIADRLLIDDKVYVINSSPILPDVKIDVGPFWVEYSLPPGLTIKRIAAKEDPVCAIYYIIIWQQYRFYATCMHHKDALTSLPTGLPQQPA